MRSKPARARSSAPGMRRKRASWCSARIRPWISNSIWSASVSARRWPSSIGDARSRARAPPARSAPSSTSASRTGPGPVVELDRAADVDAARVDLDRHAPHPALEQRAQARQAARLAHRRAEHLFLELRVVLADRPRSAVPRASRSGRTRPTCSSASPRPARRSTGLRGPCARPGRARRRGSRRGSAGPSSAALGAAASAGGASSVSEARESKAGGPTQRSAKTNDRAILQKNGGRACLSSRRLRLTSSKSRVERSGR